jgi:hypothetical protein
MPNLTSTNEEWRAFQDRVADLLRRIPGCRVSVGEYLHGARIGTVQADVVARFRGLPTDAFGTRPIEFLVIVECKFWRSKIPQEKIFSLKTIVEDVGASMGILLSDAGVQTGVLDYLQAPNNIMAMTFTELEASVSNKPVAACSVCGTQTILPFPPDPNLLSLLLCLACHRASKQSFGGSR